ncbi:MAG: S1C family serine protease [Chloroflexota bacterium]
MSTLLTRFSDAMADAVADVRRSVVQITDGGGSIGAGTVWHADGLIITNAHVVLRWEPLLPRRGPRQRASGAALVAPALTVVLPDHHRLRARVIATDVENDLAALAVDAHDLPTIALGDSRSVRTGQWVMALGHPWGMRDAATAGVVIGMGADLPEMQPDREWLALNLTLRPGHSGGPLVDTQGYLLGINTMISGPEVGFAVPVHVVKAFLKASLGRNAGDAVTV